MLTKISKLHQYSYYEGSKLKLTQTGRDKFGAVDMKVLQKLLEDYYRTRDEVMDAEHIKNTTKRNYNLKKSQLRVIEEQIKALV